jgi:hypothetical protein
MMAIALALGDILPMLQGLQLACLADAVLVEVAPYAQLVEVGIQAVDHAVAVAVLSPQSGVAVSCVDGAVQGGVEQAVVAKQFASAVYYSVAVDIDHQQAVVAFDPAGAGFNAIGIVVKQDGGQGVNAHGLDAVAVQV